MQPQELPTGKILSALCPASLDRIITGNFPNQINLRIFGYSGTKNSPNRKFTGWISRGRPGVIRADVPGQNFGQALETLEKQVFGCGHS